MRNKKYFLIRKYILIIFATIIIDHRMSKNSKIYLYIYVYVYYNLYVLYFIYMYFIIIYTIL